MNIWEKLTDTTGPNKIIKEFEKRYYNTILGHKTETNIEYLKFWGTDDNSIFYFKDECGINKKFTLLNNPELFPIKLQKGFYFNHKNEIFYISLEPKRQWKRSLSFDNYKAQCFSYLFDKDHTPETYSFSDLFQFVKNKPILKVDNTIFGRCFDNNFLILNPNFLLTKHIYSPAGFSLFYHKYLIGHFNGSTTDFYLEESPFLQEFIEEKDKWFLDFNIHY